MQQKLAQYGKVMILHQELKQETPDPLCAIKPSNGSADNHVTVKSIKNETIYFKTGKMTTNVTKCNHVTDKISTVITKMTEMWVNV